MGILPGQFGFLTLHVFFGTGAFGEHLVFDQEAIVQLKGLPNQIGFEPYRNLLRCFLIGLVGLKIEFVYPQAVILYACCLL